MDSKKILFNTVSNFNKKVAMLSNYTSMPKNIEWPKNVDGKLLQCIAHIPTNFLNEILSIELKSNHAISIFTYYDRDDYFLDKITYAGDQNDFKTVLSNTKVIFHEIGNDVYSLNKIDFPLNEFIISPEIIKEDYYGSKIGGMPTFIQKKNLNIEEFRFIFQLYGGDFPEDFNDIFYLSDSLGYLFIKDEMPFIGLFFTQAG